MKGNGLFIGFIIFLMTCNSLLYGQEKSGGSTNLSAGLITGYNRGFGIQGNFTISDFAEEFPFELRFGVGYTFLDPGNAADARRIFINNATNGVPEKNGGSFDFRLDFLLPQPIFGIKHSYIVFGPRFSTFKGNFKFIGGNEDFDVNSNQWGIGGGLESYFKMTQKLDLVVSVGLDYYFPSTLKGHDTAYSPDNVNVNPRNDNQNEDTPFTYKDADDAINQPKFMPRIMIGINFNL